MSWEEAFHHPLFRETPVSSNILRDRDEKENRTPKRQLMIERL